MKLKEIFKKPHRLLDEHGHFHERGKRLAEQTVLDFELLRQDIDYLRYLELDTQYIDLSQEHGWHTNKALSTYATMIRCYTLLHATDLSAAQVDTLLSLANEMKRALPAAYTDDFPTDPVAHANYHAPLVIENLNKHNRTVVASGYDEHANYAIIEKKSIPSIYTCTFLDAGGERDQQTILPPTPEGAQAVVGRSFQVLQPDKNLGKLIGNVILLQSLEYGSNKYYKAIESIRSCLSPEPIAEGKDDGQRRGNCTTRGLRTVTDYVLADSRLKDRTLLRDSLRNFITSAELGGTAIYRQLLALNETIGNQAITNNYAEVNAKDSQRQALLSMTRWHYESNNPPRIVTFPFQSGTWEEQELRSMLEQYGMQTRGKDIDVTRGIQQLVISGEDTNIFHDLCIEEIATFSTWKPNSQAGSPPEQRISLVHQSPDSIDALVHALEYFGVRPQLAQSPDDGNILRVFGDDAKRVQDIVTYYQQQQQLEPIYSVTHSSYEGSIHPNAISYKKSQQFQVN